MGNGKRKVLTSAERKRNERNAKRERGLLPMEIWVHKDRKDEAKLIEKKLQKAPK